ncbi:MULTISPECIES: methionine ABC transporter permease [Pontibacillus]|uniref:Methionine ABC transporter permease n=1 Tax=Pontibacillus chungwhensis TaxID=265426 RepID=A0ABY8V0X9_9BACI|nr:MULTISPECIES: methionine ABC transporter permease [Pontibacillus]MCD5325974.1 ABC transporter permease [Pontibacillus sp. HN14]WIF98429.1 methionine ABC transporter permease [Pontibacillus chungwhensis]
MIDQLITLWPELSKSFVDTLIMVGIGLVVSFIVGLPLGLLLFVTDRDLFLQNKWVKSITGVIVNLVRSVPFIILLVFLFPFTDLLLGTTTGPVAASVSLSVAAIPFYARIVESSARDIDRGVIEAAISCGASPWLIIKDIIFPEIKSGLISGLTITAISLVGYSAMAGTIGGGGIGDLAIRYGYYRYDNFVMFTTVILLIVMVQVIQYVGDFTAKSVKKS